MKGLILIISGLSGSGKTTIANKLAKELPNFYILDGDDVRQFFGGDLGFGEGARMESGRRLCFGAHLLSDAGLNVIVTCTMGSHEIRKKMKDLIDFIEVYMDADVKDCIANDPKGVYKRNLKLDKPNLRGVDLPFEPPENPDLILYPYRETPENSFKRLLSFLEDRI
jgi:adenylylsulfate kinase-like enzyme